MDEYPFIMITTLSYLIVNILTHLILFLTTIFHNQWHTFAVSKKFLSRFFEKSKNKSINAGNESTFVIEKSSSIPLENDAFKSLITNPTSLFSSSENIFESEIILSRIIRSFGVFLCTILFLTNWFRLLIYLVPNFYPNLFSSSSNLCLIQSFFLHVFTLFHLNLTISIRLFWHYCFLFDKFWQTITYRHLMFYFFGLFFSQCFFTWPILSHKWATVFFDDFFNLCFVDYTFHFSYTFFVLSFTCIIPIFLLIFSHYSQIKTIQQRIDTSDFIWKLEEEKQRRHLLYRKQQFQYASYLILFWSLFNTLLLICVHTSFDQHRLIRMIVYYVQFFVLLIDPILYIFVFRSLSIITLLKSTQINSIFE